MVILIQCHRGRCADEQSESIRGGSKPQWRETIPSIFEDFRFSTLSSVQDHGLNAHISSALNRKNCCFDIDTAEQIVNEVWQREYDRLRD